ncbi:MAG TPA: AIPR family protein [Candidatus Brocadiia bacterium]|nr:AIPR family protein [Candidatus Brocadiales bacterium]
MDIIIEGYLKRFVEEFDLDESAKETNFEKFCHYAILKNELSFLDDNDLDQIGVGKNKGIDGICFSIDGNIVKSIQEIEDLKVAKKTFDATVHFFQSKTSSKFDDSEIANFCDTVIDFLSEKPQYPLTTESLEYHNIFLEILKLLSYLKVFNCKLYYCSTGAWSNTTTCATTIEIKKKLLKSTSYFKDSKGDSVEFVPVDNERLRKLYDKANQPFDAEFIFSHKIALNDISNVKESYIGILPFSEYKKIIVDKDTGKLKPLFYDNVRDFLGVDEEVNDKINKTIQDKQFSLFQLLNNGITIIAEDNKGRGDKFILTSSQVVNGCQTSNVLFLNKDLQGIDDLFIPVKLIITEDPDIRDRIIVSTNNQTEIKEEQLLALTSFQKNLEEFYKHMGDGLYYERRKSQYSFDPNIKKKSIVDIREQIKSYVAMFLEEPHVVSGYFGKVYKDRKSSIFNKEHQYEPYYLSALTQFTFKKLLTSKKIERKYNKARYHIFMLFRKTTEPSEKLEPHDKKNKAYCDEISKIIKEEEKCLKNFKYALEIIDSSGINIDDPKEIYKKSTTNALIKAFKKQYK